MYQRSDAGFGHGGGNGALSFDRAIPAFAPRFGRAQRSERPNPFDAIDFVPDLGRDIGSRTWWRGVATCVALIALGIGLGPRLSPLPTGAPRAMSAAVWDESRSLSIAPLAFGADSGRHMAATGAVQTLADTPERPIIDVTATLGQGDGLTRALERAGVSDTDAARVTDMATRVGSDVTPGTALAITLGRRASKTQPRPLEHLALRARFDLRLTFARVNGALTMQQQPIAIDHTPMRVTGSVGDGIFMSATNAGAPAEAVQSYIRAIAPKVSLGNLGPDARYDLIKKRDRAETGEVRFGKLLYAGMSASGRATRMIQWTIDGRTEWFDASGVGQRRGGFVMPVEGHKTSGFGMRFHPLLGYTRMHQGTDYGAVYGTPIHAVTDGIVSFAGWHGGHGNMVKLQHTGGLGTGYAHMSRIAVSPGTRVAQGQVIGYVGSTGLSTGPHLHFEVYRNGVPVNPGSVSFASTPLLSGAALDAFRSQFRAITGLQTAAR